MGRLWLDKRQSEALKWHQIRMVFMFELLETMHQTSLNVVVPYHLARHVTDRTINKLLEGSEDQSKLWLNFAIFDSRLGDDSPYIFVPVLKESIRPDWKPPQEAEAARSFAARHQVDWKQRLSDAARQIEQATAPRKPKSRRRR
jgi:hypothetical protein